MTYARLLAVAFFALPAALPALSTGTGVAFAATTPASPLSGAWKGKIDGLYDVEVSLTLQGTRVTGLTRFAQKDFPVSGTWDAARNLVTYSFKYFDGRTNTVKATLKGNTLNGAYTWSKGKPGTMTLTRVASGTAAGSDKAAAYVMTGTVRNDKGNPIAGVEVFADHTAFYNMNAVGKTDAQGRYRIPLAQQPGTWNAGAYLRGEVGGQPFEVRLSPDNDTPFDGSKGAVRDFTYKASNAPSGKVYTYLSHSNVEVDYDQLEFTFTPDGPNAAGSTAPFSVKNKPGYGMPDVPLGRYKVSATQVLNGVKQPLLLSSRGQQKASLIVLAAFTYDSHYGQTLELFLENP
ncbi:hypothetical protein K7W42_03305 [Deinococcus sp. HMF7604]|uniref:hypothetical protein n=1 Tax=Deinococcus betulae TaxID=2873312 RepID=UPI001CCB874E|nr:hypothetical protein [Deinococcus betulae]MBZ9749886.1 hypothetical protein [Deinococcus betulae]